MLVWFICGYRSDKARHIPELKTQIYWDAYWFCWAVKVGTHKRDFIVHRRSGNLLITKDNFGEARKIFGRFVADKIEDQSPGDRPMIVPVPSKDALKNVQAFKSLSLAQEAMAGTVHEGNVWGALRWTTSLPRSHEGGKRGKNELTPHLKCIYDLRGRTVVLIDDIMSTGSHMLACQDVLQRAGAIVLGGVACGRTIYDATTRAFGRQSYELTSEISEIGQMPPQAT